MKSFCMKLGKNDWKVEFSDDSNNFYDDSDSAFYHGTVVIRKDLSVKKKNKLLLEEIVKGAIFETNYFSYMKSLLDDKFVDFAKELSVIVGQIILQKDIYSALKVQARKERYSKRLSDGAIVRRNRSQLTFSDFKMAA